MTEPRIRESSFKCPKCGGGVKCGDSRPGRGNSIRRRRWCLAPACGHRFTTYEIALDELPLSPVAMQFMLGELAAAHAAVGARLTAITEANKAAVLITSIDTGK